MKKNIKKLLAVTLAASLCIPAIPRSMTNAAASSATFGEAEDISVARSLRNAPTFSIPDGNSFLEIPPLHRIRISMMLTGSLLICRTISASARTSQHPARQKAAFCRAAPAGTANLSHSLPIFPTNHSFSILTAFTTIPMSM